MSDAPVGRLAFRVEGDWWVCYYAMADSMEGAIEMARVMMGIVSNGERKQMFMDLMKDALADFLKGHFGERPTWREPQDAPESERSGSA